MEWFTSSHKQLVSHSCNIMMFSNHPRRSLHLIAHWWHPCGKGNLTRKQQPVSPVDEQLSTSILSQSRSSSSALANKKVRITSGLFEVTVVFLNETEWEIKLNSPILVCKECMIIIKKEISTNIWVHSNNFSTLVETNSHPLLCFAQRGGLRKCLSM